MPFLPTCRVKTSLDSAWKVVNFKKRLLFLDLTQNTFKSHLFLQEKTCRQTRDIETYISTDTSCWDIGDINIFECSFRPLSAPARTQATCSSDINYSSLQSSGRTELVKESIKKVSKSIFCFRQNWVSQRLSFISRFSLRYKLLGPNKLARKKMRTLSQSESSYYHCGFFNIRCCYSLFSFVVWLMSLLGRPI